MTCSDGLSSLVETTYVLCLYIHVMCRMIYNSLWVMRMLFSANGSQTDLICPPWRILLKLFCSYAYCDHSCVLNVGNFTIALLDIISSIGPLFDISVPVGNILHVNKYLVYNFDKSLRPVHFFFFTRKQ